MALNEKFIKARRDYEALLETSMSHPAAHYGRPPSHAPYGYAGDYPPSGDPNRYYTPTPQHNPSASPPAGGAYPPPEQSGRHSSNQYYPSQPDSHTPSAPGGAAPFYVVGQAPPGTQLPGQAGRTPSAPPTGLASLPHQHPQQSQQPPVTGPLPEGPQPQELSTPMYDTPVTAKPPGQDRPLSPSQPPGQAQYGAYQPYNSQQRPVSMNAAVQRPHYDPANTAGAGPSPISPANDSGTPSAPYPNTQQRPHSYYPGDSSTRPQPSAQDYYRQNELFLPPGSRAQG
jgi:signal transducing adaptor molecule